MNHYAVEIFSLPSDTWYGVTNANVGLVNGVFRFITDHPQYDGSTVIPTYGPDEIDVNGTSVGSATNPYSWYEGILVDESINGNPTRSIDIAIAGSYSTDSSFSFQIRGDAFINVSGFMTPFREYCQENSISFIGRTVVIWSVIDSVFCQIGRGRISDNPQEEDNFEFDVEDEASVLHKNMPALVSNPTNTPGGPDSGTCFPVVFGDVVNSKLLKLQPENVYVALQPAYSNPLITYATNYAKINNNTQSQLTIRIGAAALHATNYFAGMYLLAVAGKEANTSKLYKIISSTGSLMNLTLVTLVLDECLVDSSTPNKVVDAATFNSTYVFNDSSPSLPNMANRWWFSISPMTLSTCVTQNQNSAWAGDRGFGGLLVGSVGLPVLRSWSTDTKQYDDLSTVVDVSSTGNQIQLICNTASATGDIQIYENIPWNVLQFGISDSVSADPDWLISSHYKVTDNPNDIALMKDRIRLEKTLTKTFQQSDLSPGIAAPMFIAVKLNMLNPITIQYDEIYFLVDFNIINAIPATGSVLRVTVGPLQTNLYDIFGNFVPVAGSSAPPSSNGNMSPNNFTLNSESGYPVFTYSALMNLIMNAYYQSKNIAADPITSFSQTPNSPTNGYPLGAYFGFTQQTLSKDQLSNAWLGSIACYIQVMAFGHSGGSDTTLEFGIRFKQIALIGSRKISTVNGDVFTTVIGGEKTNASGAVSTDPGKITNDVYHAIMHIMEDLDSIPKGLIDYGTLATTRGPGTWHVGRTVEDRKNSIDYLGELFSHSFIGGFTGRTGKRTLRSWISTTTDIDGNPVLATPVVTTGNGKTTTHDNSLIVDQSIESWQKTDASSVYNSFNLQYNNDPGSNSYLRNFIVSALNTLANFPDANQLVGAVAVNASGLSLADVRSNYSLIADSLFYLTTTSDTTDNALGVSGVKGSALVISDAFVVNPDGSTVTYEGPSGTTGAVPAWFQAFGGLFNTDITKYPVNNTAYTASKQIWDLCHASYLQTQKILQAQGDIGELPWFIDRSLFDSTATWGTGTQSSAFLLLTLLAIWTTKQKDVVTYAIPLNANTYGTELLDCVNFSDVVYTGGVNRVGWVTGVEVDVNNDQLKITTTLLPVDVTTTPVAPPVVENVAFPAGSNVSNPRTNVYATPSASHVSWGVGQANIGTLVYTTNNPPTGDDDYTIDSTGKKVILNPIKWYDTILANTLGLLNVDTY
jgi:hypothetical protein